MTNAHLPPTLVRIPISETQDQRKAREKRGEPLPHFSYVAHRIEDKQDSPNKPEKNKP